MSETPITPVDMQESPDNVIHTNFGREQDPAQFLSYAESSVGEAVKPREGIIDLDEPAEAFAIPAEREPVVEVAPKELTRTEQLHLAAKSMTSTDQVAYISAISRSLPSLREAGMQAAPVVATRENWLKTMLVGGSKSSAPVPSTRELIEREAVIGGSLFDVVPAGHRREFFCLDDHTWVWHEEWVDEAGQRQVTSTRYEVHTSGILKAQNGAVYKFIDGPELENLVVATRLYYEQVASTIYRIDPATGHKIESAAEQIAA